jgi:fucose 4-O-acetylase-like acetyltransferase
MPLFSFISGFVFAAAVANYPEWKRKVSSKARRLLLPMICVGSVHYLLQAMTTDRPQPPLLAIYFFPYEHFWYLQATFLLMAAHLSLAWLVRSSVRAAATLLAIGAVSHVLGLWEFRLFSLGEALYLATFFFSGHLLAVYQINGRSISLPTTLAIVSGILLTALLYAKLTEIVSAETVGATVYRAFQLLIGLATCAVLMSAKWESPLLARIGLYSYAIYLFHVVFTAGTRIAFEQVWPTIDRALLFLPCLAAGIIGPIVLMLLIVRSPTASLLFLGVVSKKAPTGSIAMPKSPGRSSP